MAINKVMQSALKALSYPDIHLKKNYKLVRTVTDAAHYSRLPPFYKTWDHKIPCGDHEIPVRIFAPTDKERNPIEGNHPILLFFHGGGWVTGNIDSYNKVCRNLARNTRHTVVSVDYQLAPEHPFPAAPEDCYTVARELFLRAELLGVSPGRITLIGDSAGGNLAAAVSLMARDRGEFLPSRQILLYPATYNDHGEDSPFPSIRENGTDYLLTSKRVRDYMDLYLGSEADRRNPYFAPLLAPDLSHQPNTLVVTAEYDPLRDEGEAYAKRLAEAGNEVKAYRMIDALHGFIMLPPGFAVVQDTYEVINQFLSEVPKN